MKVEGFFISVWMSTRTPDKHRVTLESDKLVLPFVNSANTKYYYSQAEQDVFVLSCLNGKTGGTFLELGCDDPYRISNSYLLESEFGWKGISVDINEDCEWMFKESTRTCTLMIEDATTINFDTITATLGTSHIDYLSLDLEPASITLKCLQNIPLDKVSFSVITFEHDHYRFGDDVRSKSRDILTKAGYVMLCENVNNFEDWYVNPAYVDMEYVRVLKKRNQGQPSAKTIVFK